MTDKPVAHDGCRAVLDREPHRTDQTVAMTPRELAARLWPDSDRLSIEGLEAEAGSVPDEIRGEFLANLIDLVEGLQRKRVAKDEIVARVIDEIVAARGEADPTNKLDLEFDIEL